MTKLTRWVVFFGWVGGCAASDLNQPCVLMQHNPDGGPALPLLEGQLDQVHPQAVVSKTGACSRGWCVRDVGFVPTAKRNEPAEGYCSTLCDPHLDVECGGQTPTLTCQHLIRGDAAAVCARLAH